jgi:hypothetical protein
MSYENQVNGQTGYGEQHGYYNQPQGYYEQQQGHYEQQQGHYEQQQGHYDQGYNQVGQPQDYAQTGFRDNQQPASYQADYR